MSGVGGLLELIGGALIVVGLFMRPVAFLHCGEMAVAYFYAHFPRNFFPVINGGDAAILYCFVFLYRMFAGAGPWSIDAVVARPTTISVNGMIKPASARLRARAAPMPHPWNCAAPVRCARCERAARR